MKIISKASIIGLFIDRYIIGVDNRYIIPKINDEDIRYFCYVIVDFDSSTISFLMNMTKENVRVKSDRLRARLSKYSGLNKDLYALFL